MKKYISILLILLMLIPNATVTASAKEPCYLIGDSDRDGELTILDATHIQRRLADLSPFDRLGDYLGDVDGDGQLSILDATCIQRRLAAIENAFYKEKLYPWSASIIRIDMNANSSTVQAGTTVQFTIVEEEHAIPSEYEIYVDGLQLGEHTAHCVFSYTFADEGSYRIAVIAYDPFGGTDVYTLDMTAVKEAEPPVITYAAYDKNTEQLTVRVSGGVAPYEYQYTIRNNIAPPEPGPTYTALFTYETDEDGNYYLLCRYCPDSTVYIPTYLLTKTLSYYCEVQVRGADGAVSEIKKVQIVLQ